MLAHLVEGGTGPVPPWMLSYIGAFAVLAVAVWLRAAWLKPRLAEPAATAGAVKVTAGNFVGVALFALTMAAAVVGPDSAAANVAPVAVLVTWWVGLPLVALVAGDVMRLINPFVPFVPDRREADGSSPPTWTGAAFLFAFAWFWMAYHRPGSPRSLAVFLAVYAAAAVAGGWVWGRRWLGTGEGFGALAAAVATISPRHRSSPIPPGLAATMVVWLGSSAFDAFSSTPFWQDVLGSSLGWDRTFLNSVGLVWITAIVAGAYLIVTRVPRFTGVRDPAGSDDEPDLAVALGWGLVPLAVGWFVAHDLTLLLFEGQNFIALMSDPVGRGWDLFGTINRTIDYTVVEAAWVAWAQLAALLFGHVATIVLTHDLALRRLPPRAALPVTWAMTVAAAASLVAAALTVVG